MPKQHNKKIDPKQNDNNTTKDWPKTTTMAKRAAETVLDGLQKRYCEMQARIEGQKEDIARKKVENELAAAKAAEEAARIEEQRMKAELARKIEQAAKDKVAKLEQEARNGRAFLLDIDVNPEGTWKKDHFKYCLINPVLDGKLPVNGTSKKDLLTEVLKANVDERIKMKNELERRVSWCGSSSSVAKQQIYSISISVNEEGEVHYRVVYNGYTDPETNRTRKNKYVYFNIDLYGSTHLYLEKGCYMKKYVEDEEKGWFNFYLK